MFEYVRTLVQPLAKDGKVNGDQNVLFDKSHYQLYLRCIIDEVAVSGKFMSWNIIEQTLGRRTSWPN